MNGVPKCKCPEERQGWDHSFFLQNRLNRSTTPKAHIRAFAGEVITAVMLIGFFVDVWLKPQADVEAMQYIQCFELLRITLAIFQRGNLDEFDTARNAIHAHHAL